MSLDTFYWLENPNHQDEYLLDMKTSFMRVDFAMMEFDTALMNFQAPIEEIDPENPLAEVKTSKVCRDPLTETTTTPTTKPATRAERRIATRNKKKKFLKGNRKNPPNIFKENGSIQPYLDGVTTYLENGVRRCKEEKEYLAGISAVKDAKRGAETSTSWQDEWYDWD